METTRRRTQRATLLQPLVARAGEERAYVVDVSISGIRLSHSNLLSARKACPITLEWETAAIEFTAELRWTHSRGIDFQSGFEIQAIDDDSRRALQRLVESRVEPMYECHELAHGVWRKTPTTDSRQPESGFTVSMSESVNTVDFFRAAYAKGDRAMRKRIRELAELSITHPERHYDA